MTDKLRISLRRQRGEMVKLFSAELHPTASNILDEGAKAIVSGGGGALTMRAVAKQTNIKLASLQYHFKTFNHLVSTLFSREFGFVGDLLWKVLEELEFKQVSASEALRTAAESFMPRENTPSRSADRIYFHLLAFCSYNREAFIKATAFYKFYNTLMAYLVSRVNPSLSAAECMARATLITATLEGSTVYTTLRAGGATAERTVHAHIGDLVVHYASLPASRE